MEKQNYEFMNTTALAFMGDAVYEIYVRKHVMERGLINADILHREAVRFVRADAQAAALKLLMDKLSESELNLVKRARNKKSATKPRNADPVDYKLATAFEALVGFLYLSQNHERMEELIDQTIDLIERKKGKENAGAQKEEKGCSQ
ncbi:ribonuclease III [Anoxybacterium hadale]|uniref:Ribonuclease III n=1 Tax=Anoxybacterium hadale TaxID=3408580 RepID=A0ACD1AGA5_9FIRM|nr:ribonuclease III [Clostridiales bacterium]